MIPCGAGNNPAFGRDPGPPPPFGPLTGASPPPDFGAPPPGTIMAVQTPYYAMPSMGMPHIPGIAMPLLPGLPPQMYPYYTNPYYAAAAPPPYTAAPPGMPGGPPHQLGTAMAVDAQGQVYQYVSGLNGSGRFPQPAPVVDPDFPAANHINSTGGAGAEPGFNYFFPTEHAKLIVLKCAVPPWTLVPGSYGDLPFHAAKVPANVTMAELLVGFGAENPEKAKNQFWEVYPKGGGKWGWKEHCTGDDEIMMARTVRDMGWVEKREGTVPTVYLWISKV